MAADVETIVHSDRLDKRRAQRIERASRRESPVNVYAKTRRFSREASLSTPAAHEALAEDYDSRALTWSMTEHGRELFADTLEWLFDQFPERFTLEVRWPGEAHEVEELVSREELLRIVRAGRLQQRARYVVEPAGS
jgi:hypothetical protein